MDRSNHDERSTQEWVPAGRIASGRFLHRGSSHPRHGMLARVPLVRRLMDLLEGGRDDRHVLKAMPRRRWILIGRRDEAQLHHAHRHSPESAPPNALSIALQK